MQNYYFWRRQPDRNFIGGKSDYFSVSMRDAMQPAGSSLAIRTFALDWTEQQNKREVYCIYIPARCSLLNKYHRTVGANWTWLKVFFSTGTGPETAVTGVTGPDRFRYRPVSNRSNSKLQIWIKKNKKFPKNS